MDGATGYQKGIEAGEELLGTCKTLVEAGYEAWQNDRHFCAGLDDTAVLCSGCEWWCEPCEIDDDGYCEDCCSE